LPREFLGIGRGVAHRASLTKLVAIRGAKDLGGGILPECPQPR